jgi:hypothetical protein
MDFGKVAKWGAAAGAAYFIYSAYHDVRSIESPPAIATGGIIESMDNSSIAPATLLRHKTWDTVVKSRDALQDATHSPPKKVELAVKTTAQKKKRKYKTVTTKKGKAEGGVTTTTRRKKL